MRPGNLLKPLGVFVAVIVAVVALTFLGGLALGGSSPASDAGDYSQQAPSHFQPDEVIAPTDAEQGEIQLNAGGSDTDILIDTQHANRFTREDIEPLVNALVRNGHNVRYRSSNDDDGFGASGYNETLQKFDAVLIINPTDEFPESHVAGLERFAEAGGHIAVLAEPTQLGSGSGPFTAPTTIDSSASDLTAEFGIRVSADTLYNVDDTKNDNNYQSIYGLSAADDSLVNGVNRVNFDRSAHLFVQSDSDATTLLRAPEGTKKMSTRRTGEYALAARNGNVFVTADSSFVTVSEVYDSDNEKLVSNLLEFLAQGDKPDDVPETEGDGNGFGDDGTPSS